MFAARFIWLHDWLVPRITLIRSINVSSVTSIYGREATASRLFGIWLGFAFRIFMHPVRTRFAFRPIHVSLSGWQCTRENQGVRHTSQNPKCKENRILSLFQR